MNKIKILALFGESASGKDTIQKWIVSHHKDTKSIISCTTRPKRDYEIPGIDYFFLNDAEFATKVLDGSMLEATCFRNWFYGTPIDVLDENKLNVGVFNPEGIEALLADGRLTVLPVWVKASPKTRLLRSLKREKNPDCREICRRFIESDIPDFANIDFRHITLKNDKKLDKRTINYLVKNFDAFIIEPSTDSESMTK